MGNYNRKTQKHTVQETAAALRPVLTIANGAAAAGLTNTGLTDEEDNKVTAFVALNGTMIPSGQTVEDLLRVALGRDCHPEFIGRTYSVRISQAHRIEYYMNTVTGQAYGGAQQFQLTIANIGNPKFYKH